VILMFSINGLVEARGELRRSFCAKASFEFLGNAAAAPILIKFWDGVAIHQRRYKHKIPTQSVVFEISRLVSRKINENSLMSLSVRLDRGISTGVSETPLSVTLKQASFEIFETTGSCNVEDNSRSFYETQSSKSWEAVMDPDPIIQEESPINRISDVQRIRRRSRCSIPVTIRTGHLVTFSIKIVSQETARKTEKEKSNYKKMKSHQHFQEIRLSSLASSHLKQYQLQTSNYAKVLAGTAQRAHLHLLRALRNQSKSPVTLLENNNGDDDDSDDDDSDEDDIPDNGYLRGM